MASPDRSKRKILKAKKTMPASCRKQIEILNELKNVEALKTASIGNNVQSDKQNSSSGVINNKCRSSKNDTSSLDFNENSVCSEKCHVVSQNLIKPLEFGLETRLQYIEEQVVPLYQKPSKSIESPRKLSTQDTKDSHNTSENHFDYQANVTRSFFEQHKVDCNMKSISYPHSILSDMVQMPKSTIVNTLDDSRIDKMVSHLETHYKSQNDTLILSSDTHFVPVDKTPVVVNSVISSNCTNDSLKGEEESCRTCHSSISICENTDSTRLSSLDTDRNNSYNQKKRMFSENKENVKRMKTSEQINENICVALEKQTTLLEQVRHLIRQEICSINYNLFDNKLRELTERIVKTECRNKHEAVADELFGRVAKLQRRIKKALSQRNYSEPNMLSSDTVCKVANSENLNLDKNPEAINNPDEKRTYVNSESSNPSEKASERIDLSQDHEESISESNDDVMLISVESPSLTTPITSNLTDSGKITSGNSHNSPNAVIEVMCIEKKKLDSVIDLTKEGLSNYNTENPLSTLESSMKSISISKETTPGAQNTTQVLESFEHLPPLPAPPPLLPELMDRIRDTLPPQKPELKVKRVLRPRGIALTWNITKINPKCAPVESYHLFLCHENPTNKLIWKKIGEIKALPLPMACTLSQFLVSNKYYFTVQSKDIFGRYGPFCDIKSIPGFSETLT